MAENGNWQDVKALGVIMSLGGTIAGGVLVGFWLGRFLDKKLHTEPWLTVVMLLVGIAAGFKAAYDTMTTVRKGDE
ncbi:ATP synthase protein I [Carboxydocella thermautotrophica]|nr:ATP synthase protein I [Carboxydocella thermautotrophica]